MSETQAEILQSELRSKRICRFCMAQNEPLSNIYSRENRLKSSAPLPLQVMACVSIEVFTNDGMPNTICDNCRMLMEHCYRFKQMCKKADTALRQYPLTGTWPSPLDIPKLPEELVVKQYPSLSRKTKEEISPVPVEKQGKNEIIIISPSSSKASKTTITTTPTATTLIKKETPGPGRPPKLLNKHSVRILNKNAQVSVEPILSKPVIKRNDAGNVELVTEIIEQKSKYQEPDPIKDAAPIETNVFPCPHCERSFPLRQLLDIHMVNHTRERSFECNICEKRFFSKYDLGKHMLIHTGEKPFECVVCKKAFTRSTLLHRHEKIHTDQPKFLCVYCEKPFLSKSELEKHTERHKKNRPFACKICGKCFAFKQGLERHETVHAKEQPFPCQYCDQSFPTPSKLSRHLTAHAGSRPFPCRLCPNSYLLSHHLTRHMRSHTGSGSYKCYDCEKTFKTRDDLIYHSAVHATQTLVCPLCKEQFNSLDLVTEHIKLHAEGEQFACEFCDLIFMTADKLQTHSDAEHSEDLAVYEEHTKNNMAKVKREAANQFTDDSQDTANEEEGEVIEEFIIEEYHHDQDAGNSMDVGEGSYLKEENEIVLGKDIIVSTGTKRSYARISKDEIQTIQKESLETSNIMDEEGDYAEMDIETFEREDEETEIPEEHIEESSPPPKIAKITRKSSSSPVRAATVTKVKETPKPMVTRRLGATKIETKDEIKLKQTTISSVLQQLPKSVTVIKKEKGVNEKIPESKEIKILNEKIVKKAIAAPPQILNKSANEKQKNQSENKVKQVKQIKQITVSPKNTETPSTTVAKVLFPNDKKSPKESVATSSAAKTTSPAAQKATITQTINKKLVEMVIGDRKVKVKKIMMTKAEVEAMTKEGKIEMKGNTMILKQDNKTIPGKVVATKKPAVSADKK